jgi:hypothetical protein
MVYEERDAEIRRAWMEECWAAIGGRSALDLEQQTQVPMNLLHAFSSHGERPQPQHVVQLARATQGDQWAAWSHRVLRMLNYGEVHLLLALGEAYQPPQPAQGGTN